MFGWKWTLGRKTALAADARMHPRLISTNRTTRFTMLRYFLFSVSLAMRTYVLSCSVNSRSQSIVENSVYIQIRDQGVVNDLDIELSTFRLVGRRPLMKTHLPSNLSAHPNRRPQTLAVGITSIIYMGRNICEQGNAVTQNNPLEIAGLNYGEHIAFAKLSKDLGATVAHS